MVEQFNAWLERHMGVKKSESLQDEHLRKLHILLGGSYGQAIREYRKGNRTAPVLVMAIRELVGLDGVENIRVFRRDSRLAESLQRAVKIHAETGCAPDGGSLQDWAYRNLENLNRSFGTAEDIADEAAREIWESVFASPLKEKEEPLEPPAESLEPPANIYRRRRILQARAA